MYRNENSLVWRDVWLPFGVVLMAEERDEEEKGGKSGKAALSRTHSKAAWRLRGMQFGLHFAQRLCRGNYAAVAKRRYRAKAPC
jgi:hypothetical protein